MSFLDLTHPGMEDMDLYEKRKIFMVAIQKAKIMNKSKFIITVFIVSLVCFSPAITIWFVTGLRETVLITFLLVALAAPLIINKIAKPYYIPFIQEVIKNQELILGDDSHRQRERKKRNINVNVGITVIAIVCLYSMYNLT